MTRTRLGFFSDPTNIVLDELPNTTNGQRVDFGNEAFRYYQFNNRTPYWIVIRWDWAVSDLRDSPDLRLKPWCDQPVQLPENPEQGRLCFMATSKWPAAANPTNLTPKFFFEATRIPLGVGAFPNIAITDAPTQNVSVTSDLTQLIDIDEATSRNTLRARLLADAFDRIEIKNTGAILIGDGSVAPVQKYLYTILDDDTKSAGALPSTYPDGISLTRRTDGAGGAWPGSGNGEIITHKRVTSGYTKQEFVDQASNEISYRSGQAGDTWSAWATVATRGYVGSREAADAPALAAGWANTIGIRVRRTHDNFVQVSGRVTNNSGASKPGGSRIFTLGVNYRPLDPGVWACARSDGTGLWLNASIMPINAQTDGTLQTLDQAIGNGGSIDLAGVGFFTDA